MGTVIAVEESANKKTGKVSATYVTQDSCPSTCSFLHNGCYAESGPIGIHTSRLNKAPHKEAVEIAADEKIAIEGLTGKHPLRVHVVGDCKTDEAAKLVSNAMLSHTGKFGQPSWTYTHAWASVKRDSWGNASVLASVERTDQVRDATKRGYATAIVVDEHPSRKVYNKDGIDILPCPAEFSKGIVTCRSCGLCAKDKMLLEKELTIGFAAHGAGTKKVREVVG